MTRDESTKARRLHNERQIRKFVIFFDNIFPSSAGSTFNLEAFENKPESTMPIPENDRTWDFIEDLENQKAAKYLYFVLREMKREVPHLYHMAGLIAGWTKPLQLEETDHAALRRWEAGETRQDRDRAKLFERAISWIEERLNHKHPTLRINVTIPRKDESVGSKSQAAYQDRKWETEDSLRRLHRDWCILHYLHDYSSEAARYEVGEWHDVSPKKVERAITHCNKELRERRKLISRYFVDKREENKTRWEEAV